VNVRIERVDQSRMRIELVGRFGDADAPGLDFPRVNQVVRREGTTVFGVAPDKSLVVTVDSSRVPAGKGLSVVELSDARVIFEVSGSDARALLAKGTPFPVEDAAFDASACAMTRLAGIAVLLEPLAADRVRLHVASSYAQHAEEWLRDAALEEG
jgi:sarcosine oxidase subunit gamma